MGRDLDLDDVVAQYPEAKRELEQLRDDLAAARAELADMRIELDAARDNVEEWVKRYKAQSSKFNWDKSSDANPNNWR